MTDILNAIKASTPDSPVLLSIKEWQHEADPEMIVSCHIYNPPSTVPPVTLWAGDQAKNVRATPAGAIVGQLSQGVAVDVDMGTLIEIVPNKWCRIVSVNFRGNWIAINVLSAVRPPIPGP